MKKVKFAASPKHPVNSIFVWKMWFYKVYKVVDSVAYAKPVASAMSSV